MREAGTDTKVPKIFDFEMMDACDSPIPDDCWRNLNRRRCLSEAGSFSKRVSGFNNTRNQVYKQSSGEKPPPGQTSDRGLLYQNTVEKRQAAAAPTKMVKLKRARKYAISKCVEVSGSILCEENNNNNNDVFEIEDDDIRKKCKRKSLPLYIQQDFVAIDLQEEFKAIAKSKDEYTEPMPKPEKTRKVKEKMGGIKYAAYKMFSSLPRRAKRLLYIILITADRCV